jgi:hypothetical protein
MAERTYSVIDEAHTIIGKLVERYPDVLWQVRPHQVVVLGIENKEPTKRSPSYKVRAINNAEKALFKINKIETRFIVEIFWSAWNEWDSVRREWILLNSLLRVSVDEGKLLRPDAVEFKLILDKVSFDWDEEGSVLPALTVGPLVEFDMDLRPGIEDEDEEED